MFDGETSSLATKGDTIGLPMTPRVIFSILTSLACLFGFFAAASAAPGDLDTTFSLDGKVIDTLHDPASEDIGYATAVQADGKILVAGSLDSSRELIGIIRYHCGIVRYNVDGSLDTTFDGDGKVFTSFSNSWVCRALAIQPDGKIVVGGSTSPFGAGADFALLRYNPDGSPDTSFSVDGRVTTHISGYDTVTAVVIQPDGKIIAAGVTNATGNSNFAAVRYHPDGSVDTSFDGDGKVDTDFFGTFDYANAAALQADGKIVVAGYCRLSVWNDFGLIRYNADGSLDTSFDTDGKLVTNISDLEQTDGIAGVAIQANGKIVATGTASMAAGSSIAVARYNENGSFDTSFDGDGKVTTTLSGQIGAAANALVIQGDGKILVAGVGNGDFALVRYNTDGMLDNTFDGDGKVTTNFFSYDSANAVAIHADGRIVACGFFTFGSSDYDFAVARYNGDGSLDTSFDGDGKTTTPMGVAVTTVANDVVTQPDGKVVIAGYAYNGANDDFMVARYNVDGSPDTSFSADGKITIDLAPQNPFGERAMAIAIQPDGKIVVGGHTNPSGNNPDFALVRLLPNGAFDSTFSGGFVTTSFSSSEYLNDIEIQPDGKIVAAGYTFVSAGTDIAVARYNADGTPDTSFDVDGKLTTDFAGGGDRADGVAVQSDGKVVVAGAASTGPGYDFALVRYNVDGSLDSSFDGDGKLTTEVTGLSEGANAIAIQFDGKILAAGATGSFNALDYALVRYNSNGALDTSFDGDGKVTTNILPTDSATGIAIQSDGRIVLAGNSRGSSNSDASLARYHLDGSLDTSFGTGGTLTFDMGLGGTDYIYGTTLDPLGRIVIAGESRGDIPSETVGKISVARILSDFAPVKTPFDFDGDHKTDLSIFRPATGDWWYLRSSDGENRAFGFGNSTDDLVPGDYTGDGKTDIAVWRPASGEWFILRSEEVSYYSFPFGANDDVPAPADYDGDGRTDAAVFRPSNGTWYINKSSGGTIVQQFGASGDAPVPADYDGDGKADLAIWRASLGQWWLNRSTAGVIALTFGSSADKPVQGDYTGDGKADVAFFRPATRDWFVLRSETLNTYYSFPFGADGDVPSPGDYDGDRKIDAAVFRPSNSTWYVNRSTSGTLIQAFGQAGDIPVPSVFVP